MSALGFVAVSDPNAAAVDSPMPELVRVPGGEIRGTVIGPFLLGRTPVTNREYAPLVASGRVAPPPWWTDPGFRAPRQPVVGVTWDDAMAFAQALADGAGGRWRLPTEAEWELAAGGGLASPRTAWGEAVPPGEIPEGPIAGPWEAGRGHSQRLRPLRHGHDRPRVVRELGRAHADRRSRPTREPGRLVAS